jgi:hypothetical protein
MERNMIFALIKDGIIENKIVAESQSEADTVCSVVHPGYQVVRIDENDPQPDIGWLFDGSAFSAP